MCVCVCLCMYIRSYVCNTYVRTYTHTLYVYVCLYSICLYACIYIYIYMVPPPQRSMFLLFVQLFSHANISSRSFSHSLTHIFFIITAGRSILKYWATLSFNMADPRSKIQDCTGLLGRYLGSGRSILKYWATLSFNMADPRSKIVRGSWGGILDLGSYILTFNMASIFQYSPP